MVRCGTDKYILRNNIFIRSVIESDFLLNFLKCMVAVKKNEGSRIPSFYF